MRPDCLLGSLSLVSVLCLGACSTASPAAPGAATESSAAAAVAKAPAKKRKRHARHGRRPGPRAAVQKHAHKPVAAPACPENMALVSGNYCRSVEQRCLEFAQDEKHGPDKNRCLRFEKPTRCVSAAAEPRTMRYCMDRYEYPNEEGELPMTLVSWTDARRLCEAQDKRLCTESEFTFACEGEEMRPYAIGFERDAQKCNIDKPYQTPKPHMLPSPMCEANASCAAEMKRIDGRRPIRRGQGVCVAVRHLRPQWQRQRVGQRALEAAAAPRGHQGRLVGSRAQSLSRHHHGSRRELPGLRGRFPLLQGRRDGVSAWFYRVVAALFAAGAAFHALRLLAPLAGDGSTPTRHGVFVVVNALAAVGLLARPRWFVLPFALLTAQQAREPRTRRLGRLARARRAGLGLRRHRRAAAADTRAAPA